MDDIEQVKAEIELLRAVLATAIVSENMRGRTDLLKRLFHEDDETKLARLVCDARK